jgi:glycerophosphoryl diester phosphodiesterase
VHPLLDWSRRLAIAHRGGAALRPENTLAAFDHALALGADGLELDVQLSADGEVVVIHDATLERTTSGRGPVARRPWRELAAIDAGWHFDAAHRYPFRSQGVGIPRLRDVLARYPAVPMIIELKGACPELAAAAVQLVDDAGARSRVCFASFEQGSIDAVRALAPGAVTSAASREIRRAVWLCRLCLSPFPASYQALQLPERHGIQRVASRRFIRLARRAGVPVQIWTVNERRDVRRLLEWGAHAVITDRPDVAVPAVAEFNRTHEA